jgi:hypothetical protein
MAITISNLKYASADNALIDMTVTSWLASPIQFTYHANDPEPLSLAVAPLISGQSIAAYSAPVAPVPASVTRRQMILGLVAAGYITSAEGIAAAQSGAVPAAVQAVINTLPDQSSKDAATITWASMSICERSNSLVAALAAANSLTSAQVDALFQSWVTL